MQQLIKRFTLFLLMLVPAVVHAQLSNIQYTTNSDGSGGVVITGFSADGTGPLTIPDNISGLTVTGIADSAFKQNQNVTSVTFPNTVTSLGPSAFYQSTALTTVSIPASVTSIGLDVFVGCPNLTSITVDPSNPDFSNDASGVLFDKNQTTLIQYPIGNAGSYVIPNTVTDIANGSFAFAVTGPSGVTIPNGVTTIEVAAFYECTSLTSISIPASVTFIGDYGIDRCASLTSFTVDPSNPSFSSVNGVLFDKNQTKLIQYPPANPATSYTIPGGPPTIKFDAFYGATNLTSVTFPNDITAVESNAFNSCTGLTTALFMGNAPAMGSGIFANVANGFTVEYYHGASGFSSPNWTTTPSNEVYPATDLGTDPSAFSSTTNNNQVTLTGWTTSGGPSGTVVIPSSINGLPVVAITQNAFSNSTNLTSITIPASVTSIGTGAFAACPSLTSITVDPSNPNYSSVSGILFDLNQTTLIQYPAGNPASTYTVPNSVTSISASAFAGSSNLTSVTITAGVTDVGASAFDSCTALTSVLFTGNAPTMGSGVFASTGIGFAVSYYHGATGFTSPNWTDSSSDVYPATDLGTNPAAFTTTTNNNQITLTGWATPGGPSGSVVIPGTIGALPVVAIAQNAFSSSTGMSSVSIPASVTSIGSGAFATCAALTSITVDPSNPNYSSTGGILFDNSQVTLIQYPAGIASSTYTIPNGVTSLGDSSFAGASNLTSVTIPSSVTSIGNSAFASCTGLTSVALPSGVTTIGASSFAGCTSLTSVIIPASVTSVGASAFANDSSLASALFSGNAPTMGAGVFASVGGSFTVVYMNGAIGFTSPNWTDSSSDTYPAVDMSPSLFFQNGTLLGILTLNPTFLPQAWTGIGAMNSGWQERAIVDLNGDGIPDIIFQNGPLIGALILNAQGNPTAWVGIGSMDSGWELRGAARVKSDNNVHLYFQNGTLLGDLQLSTAGAPISWTGIGAMDPGWQLHAVADLNGDGQPELIFQNDTLIGALQLGSNDLPTAWNGIGSLNAGWILSAAVDVNADGQPDLIFQNGTALGGLEINTSFQPVAWHGIGAMGSGWILPGDY